MKNSKKYECFSSKNDPYHLTELELNEAKLKRLREILIQSVLKEIFYYTVFLSVLFFISIGNNIDSSHNYKDNMQKRFDPSEKVKTNLNLNQLKSFT